MRQDGDAKDELADTQRPGLPGQEIESRWGIENAADRAIVATFLGAVLLGFIYTIKPVSNNRGVTLTRRGDTAVVIDTAGSTNAMASVEEGGAGTQSSVQSAASTEGEGARDSSITPVQPRSSAATGSSFPVVAPEDIETLRRMPLVVPVAGVPADRLGDSFDDARDGSRHHNAMDILAPRNTAVVSAADGRVLKLHASKAGGLTIYASDVTGRYIFLYGHLNSYRRGLTDGMPIKRGETIGFVGSTGNANPAGPHLHFAIARSDNPSEWWKGTPLNPYLVYRRR